MFHNKQIGLLILLFTAWAFGWAILFPGLDGYRLDLLAVLIAAIVTLIFLGRVLVLPLQEDERARVSMIFTVAVLLRVLFVQFVFTWSILNGGIGTQSLEYNDDWLYHLGGQSIAESWRAGHEYTGRIASAFTGFQYLVAVYYFFFGPIPFAAMMGNALWGGLVVFLVYASAFEILHDRSVARRAMWLAALMPSLILWSGMMNKDIVVVALIMLSALFTIKLLQSRNRANAIPLVLCTIALAPLRSQLIPVFLVVIVLSIVGYTPRLGLSRIVGVAVPLFLLIGSMLFLSPMQETLERTAAVYLSEFIEPGARSIDAYVRDNPDSSFAVFEGVSLQTKQYLIPLAMIYALIYPFPPWVWDFDPEQIFLFQGNLYWYAIVPFVGLGLAWLLRNRLRDSLPILALSAIILFGYALGFYGSHARYLSMVMPFFCIFAAVGMIYEQVQARRLIPVALYSMGLAIVVFAAVRFTRF